MASATALNLLSQPQFICNRLMRLTILFVAIGIIGLLACGWWHNPTSAWLALALFATYYLSLLMAAPAAAMAMFPAFSGVAVTQFISGILIESGGYLTETKETGSPTGAFLRLAIIYILFFSTAAFVIEAYIEKWRRKGQIAKFVSMEVPVFMPLAHAIDLIIFLGLAYLFFLGAKNGFPMLTGEDRFDFAKRLDDPRYLSIMGNRIWFMAYLGFMLALKPKSWLHRFLAVIVLIISALCGDKFTEFLIALTQLAGPPICRLAWNRKGLPLGKLFALGAMMVCITMPLVFFVYGGLSDSSAGLKHMEERMTLQGQLWFLADREVSSLVKFEESPIIGEAHMMLSPGSMPKTVHNQPLYYQGMSWLMIHFAPPSDANLRLETGVVYCLGLHAYFLEVLGWAGLIVLNFVFAGLLGLILTGLIYSMVYGRLMHLCFFSKFLTFWISTSMVADPYMLLNVKSFVLLMLLWLYSTLDKRLFSNSNLSAQQ